MSQLPLLGIEIRHLTALAAVDRAGSFCGAADDLGYVQSAISQQIAQLERLVGGRLVERSRGGKHVRVTAAGALLLEHAESIVGRFRAARADVAAMVHDADRSLRVGFTGPLVARMLPTLTARLSPDVGDGIVVPVDVTSDAALFARLDRGDLDAAFAELPLPPGAYDHRQVASDPMMLLVHAASPLARSRGLVGPSRLDGLRLMAISGSRADARARERLAEQGAHVEVVVETDNAMNAQALVAAGLAAAIVPARAVRADEPQVIAISLDHLLARWGLALCWLRGRTRFPAPPAQLAA